MICETWELLDVSSTAKRLFIANIRPELLAFSCSSWSSRNYIIGNINIFNSPVHIFSQKICTELFLPDTTPCCLGSPCCLGFPCCLGISGFSHSGFFSLLSPSKLICFPFRWISVSLDLFWIGTTALFLNQHWNFIHFTIHDSFPLHLIHIFTFLILLLFFSLSRPVCSLFTLPLGRGNYFINSSFLSGSSPADTYWMPLAFHSLPQ